MSLMAVTATSSHGFPSLSAHGSRKEKDASVRSRVWSWAEKVGNFADGESYLTLWNRLAVTLEREVAKGTITKAEMRQHMLSVVEVRARAFFYLLYLWLQS